VDAMHLQSEKYLPPKFNNKKVSLSHRQRLKEKGYKARRKS